jgi:hypothetical protein
MDPSSFSGQGRKGKDLDISALRAVLEVWLCDIRIREHFIVRLVLERGMTIANDLNAILV